MADCRREPALLSRTLTVKTGRITLYFTPHRATLATFLQAEPAKKRYVARESRWYDDRKSFPVPHLVRGDSCGVPYTAMATKTRSVGQFPCPGCGRMSAAPVTDSRTLADGRERRRICKGCGKRYSTAERAVERAVVETTLHIPPMDRLTDEHKQKILRVAAAIMTAASTAA